MDSVMAIVSYYLDPVELTIRPLVRTEPWGEDQIKGWWPCRGGRLEAGPCLVSRSHIFGELADAEARLKSLISNEPS